MNLIPDWRDAWKWYSVHAATVVVVLAALSEMLPLFSALIPPTVYNLAYAALGVAVIVGRLTSQP